MKRKITHLTALMMTVCMLLTLVPMTAFAESMALSDGEISVIPEEYSNFQTRYYPKAEGRCTESFLTQLSDGHYQAVVHDDGTVYVVSFDENGNVFDSLSIELELPLWGGFYFGEEFNYVVCGQNFDSSKPSGGEVYRIIKYDQNFQRVGSVSLTSEESYTSKPFAAGNVSIACSEDLMTVYTSRIRPDGHQSNIAIRVDTDSMTVYDPEGMEDYPDVHVSHSFRQIVKYDGKLPVYVDLSDSNPERSVYLQSETLSKALLRVSGGDGYNVTNTEVSGLEISDTHYFVTGTYIKDGVQNVFLAAVNKDSGEHTIHWLSDATMFDAKTIYMPKLVKLSGSRFLAMWNVLEEQLVQYVIFDQNGAFVCGQKEKQGVLLTDSQPIFTDDKVVWLSVSRGEIAVQEITDLSEVGAYKAPAPLVEPVDPWDGSSDVDWYDENAAEYRIYTAEQLAGMRALVADGADFTGKTVYLENDVFMNDLSYAMEWKPIPTWNGTFHGQGHTIYNLYVGEEAYGGLFGTIEEGATVKAVNISQGIFYTGCSVAAQNRGIVAFCNNHSYVLEKTVSVSGGICKFNQNLVYGCKNYGLIQGDRAGGIVGLNEVITSVVSQCSNHGVVEGEISAAGIVHSTQGWVYDCYNRGTVSGFVQKEPTLWIVDDEAQMICGIVHQRTGDITNNHVVESCYSTGQFNYASANPYSISYSGVYEESVVNCYSLTKTAEKGLTQLTDSQMMEPSFVEALNRHSNNMISAWMEDTVNINDGYPITVADYNGSHGLFKIQPELWIVWNDTLEIEQGKNATSFCSGYYNEASMSVSIEDEAIADVKAGGNTIEITGRIPGETYLLIHFDETENVVAADYRLKIIVTPSAEEEMPGGECGDDLTWTYDTAQKTLTVSGTGELKGLYYGADEPWKQYAAEIAAVIVEQGVSSIGYNRFVGLSALNTVQLPESLTEIGSGSFQGCTMLEYVYIPKNVSEIGGRAFSQCERLEALYVDGDNAYFSTAADGALYNKAQTELVIVPNYITDTFTVPSTVNRIAPHAVYGGQMNTIIISEGVETIGEYAFSNCVNLQNITIPSTLTHIEKNVFENVSNIINVSYGGTEKMWNAIQIDRGNEALTNASIQFTHALLPSPTAAPDPSITPTPTPAITPTPIPTPTPNTPDTNRFIDVSAGDYFYAPVLWAVSNNITGGIGEGRFGPNSGCTRAQVVTFLWAANGKPAPENSENSFTDVGESDYYYNAVLWAVENGITGGVADGLFGPEQTCTRGQIVTFLYAAQGKPAISGTSGFSDVEDTDWYAEAVLWAAQNEVTGGIGDRRFGPNNTCTRGQVVTFLHKVYG